MRRAPWLTLSVLLSVAAAAPAPAQSQPAQPSDPPAAVDSGRTSPIITPRDSAVGQNPSKQIKKMRHAGKKTGRHHGKARGAGAPAVSDGTPAEQAAEPQ